MARPKGKSDVNKSEEIRKQLKATPTASNGEIVEALGKKGIEVSPTQVSNIKTKVTGGSEGSGKRGRKAAAAGGVSENEAAFFALSCGSVDKAVAEITKIKANKIIDFVTSCGGPEAALAAMERVKSRLAS